MSVDGSRHDTDHGLQLAFREILIVICCQSQAFTQSHTSNLSRDHCNRYDDDCARERERERERESTIVPTVAAVVMRIDDNCFEVSSQNCPPLPCPRYSCYSCPTLILASFRLVS